MVVYENNGTQIPTIYIFLTCQLITLYIYFFISMDRHIFLNINLFHCPFCHFIYRVSIYAAFFDFLLMNFSILFSKIPNTVVLLKFLHITDIFIHMHIYHKLVIPSHVTGHLCSSQISLFWIMQLWIISNIPCSTHVQEFLSIVDFQCYNFSDVQHTDSILMLL